MTARKVRSKAGEGFGEAMRLLPDTKEEVSAWLDAPVLTEPHPERGPQLVIYIPREGATGTMLLEGYWAVKDESSPLGVYVLSDTAYRQLYYEEE